MEQKRIIYLPPQYALRTKVHDNPIVQLRRPAVISQATIAPYGRTRTSTQFATQDDGTNTLALRRAIPIPADVDEVLLTRDGIIPSSEDDVRKQGRGIRWLHPETLNTVGEALDDWMQYCSDVWASWRGQFFFQEELRENGVIIDEGLRPPQMGALYMTLGHWKVTNSPATVVMPTGTGKTETMLALLVSQRLNKLLVVVPTSPLREQIADKFLTLGLLKQLGVVSQDAAYPVIGVLKHRPRTPEEVDTFFQRCNVVVTTMSVAGGSTDEVQRRMAELCTHLFIDEAHHISAPTWERFRRYFLHRHILQFTATPFRSDGKHIDGKIIFNYPLRKAQKEGYFRHINFRPISAYSQPASDKIIAQVAVEQLARDLNANLNHIVMARAEDIRRAEVVYEIYQRCGAAYNPVLIHSDKSDHEKREVIRQLRAGESRIAVCVDMLGEGFDLPELKIAALHDMHKSLAITLQFTGRFTRTKSSTASSIGDATMVANIADADVEDALRDLYAEDSDWNYILRRLSEGETGRQVRRSEFLNGFEDIPEHIPLQNVFPKMSTVVYKTHCRNWRPDKIQEHIKELRLYAGPTVNQHHKVALFVTREREAIPWGDIKDIYNTVWDLYLVHWDAQQNLLFINSSNNDSVHEELAKAIAGDDVVLIRGETVFRTLYGINRLILMNLGLGHSLSRAVRFTMYAGSDISQGLSEASYANKYKSNLFGRGYENGDKASIGCSYKGRIWSYKIAYDISEWVEWCHSIGRKVLDGSINVKSIMEHVIVPTQIRERPSLVPLTIEWSEDFLQRREDSIHIDIAGEVVPFYEAGLELVGHAADGPIRFRIFTETKSAEYEVEFRENSVEYIPTGEACADIIVSRRRKSLAEWFQQEPPVIRFENGAFLIYNDLFEIPVGDRVPFDPQRIEAWRWDNTDLKKESQTTKKFTDSIQYRVLQRLKQPDYDPQYDIIFDDDDAHEAADIVALKVMGDRLVVHLYHLKYSQESRPGARIEDLYAVCGQAQRSVYWKGDVQALIEHLRNRDEGRTTKHNVSRFERGGLIRLIEISRQLPFLTPDFKIFVIQPGLSKAQASVSQLELLASTELYLQETFAIPFGVIASE